MIYHNESGNFVEYSPATHSPYFQKSGKFLYVGPNEYYVKDMLTSKYFYIFGDSPLIGENVDMLYNASVENDNFLDSTL